MKHFKLPRLRVQLFGYVFSPGWLPTLVTLLLLSLLVNLGVWQLHRAQAKRYLEKEFATNKTAINLNNLMSTTSTKTLQYQHAQVSGYFDNQHSFYLDNKIHQQQVGYQVLTPLVLPNNTVILINRGFIPAKNRKLLPPVKPLTGMQSIIGLIYFPSKTFMLKRQMVSEGWPKIIQDVDIKQLQAYLQTPIYPYYLLQQNEDGTKLIKDWTPVNFPSYRHTGYAIQWFLLALTLLIIYITLNTSRH